MRRQKLESRMKKWACTAVFVSSFFILHSSLSQSVLTADGLAAFGTNTATGGGGGGGGGDDLVNISLQWLADDISQSDGSSVVIWPDHLGNGNGLLGGWDGSGSALQTVGQPVVKNSVVNGHNTVLFDGVDDRLGTNILATAMGTATANTVFIVIKQDGSQANNCAASWNFSDFGLYATFSDLLIYDYPFNSSSGRISKSQPAGWDNNWHVLEVYRNGGTSEILVDGSSLGTASVSGSFVTSGSHDFILGCKDYGNTAPFKGDIAEIRVYNVAKDSTSRSNIRSALKSKYGTP
jgi:hypothetical protein